MPCPALPLEVLVLPDSPERTRWLEQLETMTHFVKGSLDSEAYVIRNWRDYREVPKGFQAPELRRFFKGFAFSANKKKRGSRVFYVSNMRALLDTKPLVARRCIAAAYGFSRTESIVNIGFVDDASIREFLSARIHETWWLDPRSEPVEFDDIGTATPPFFTDRSYMTPPYDTASTNSETFISEFLHALMYEDDTVPGEDDVQTSVPLPDRLDADNEVAASDIPNFTWELDEFPYLRRVPPAEARKDYVIDLKDITAVIDTVTCAPYAPATPPEIGTRLLFVFEGGSITAIVEEDIPGRTLRAGAAFTPGLMDVVPVAVEGPSGRSTIEQDLVNLMKADPRTFVTLAGEKLWNIMKWQHPWFSQTACRNMTPRITAWLEMWKGMPDEPPRIKAETFLGKFEVALHGGGEAAIMNESISIDGDVDPVTVGISGPLAVSIAGIADTSGIKFAGLTRKTADLARSELKEAIKRAVFVDRYVLESAEFRKSLRERRAYAAETGNAIALLTQYEKLAKWRGVTEPSDRH